MVFYHFIPDSVKVNFLVYSSKKSLSYIAADIGIYVCSVITDMGSSIRHLNVALVGSLRHTRSICNSVAHPAHPGKTLYFISHVPHLLKCLRSGLMKNRNLCLPDSFKKKSGMSSYSVSCERIERLSDVQNKDNLKLAPKLNEGITCPTHLQQIDVGEATSFFPLQQPQYKDILL